MQAVHPLFGPGLGRTERELQSTGRPGFLVRSSGSWGCKRILKTCCSSVPKRGQIYELPEMQLIRSHRENIGSVMSGRRFVHQEGRRVSLGRPGTSWYCHLSEPEIFPS